MDFKNLHNPYDFANPVRDPHVFAGRNREIEEIQYYLKQAYLSSRPINFALVGERASGKTSLLNMVQFEATTMGFYVVRVDLDESDVQSQLVFFAKLFDSLFTEVCDRGGFSGLRGKTYDQFRDMIDAFIVPDDKTFCPFIFPIQYAKALAAGNMTVPVSDPAIRRDLNTISSEVGCPIAILFDECDVFSKSHTLLQKLRNVFMNLDGYLLVFTGTETLFPIMDDVFSPIIRQFKKILVQPFQDRTDTKDCIQRPLELLDVQISDVLDIEIYRCKSNPRPVKWKTLRNPVDLPSSIPQNATGSSSTDGVDC